MALVTCEKHGLRFDPASSTGCVVCLRGSRPPPREGGRTRIALLLVGLAGAVGALLVWGDVKLPGRSGVETTLRTTNRDGRNGASYVPAHDASRALPLLVAIHGSRGNGHGILAEFRDLADRRGFAIVAPDSRAERAGGTWEVADRPGEVTDDRRHVMACIAEFAETPGLLLDEGHVLIAGHSGGGSTAPYLATNETPFTAFAVLHGGAFPGGLGSRHVPGWFSTGSADNLRPVALVTAAADAVRTATGGDVAMHVFEGDHGLSTAEKEALIDWWLH